MARWAFVITDINFVPLGEIIDASSRTVSLILNKVDTASFTVRLDNRFAPLLISSACFVKAFRWTNLSSTPTLMFYGPVVSAEEVGTKDVVTLNVNCASISWMFQHWLAARSALGITQTIPIDRAGIAQLLLQDGQSEGPGPYNVDLFTGPWTAGGTSGYFAQYKNCMDALVELSTNVGGFDWRVVPVDNWVAGAVVNHVIGRFEAYPVIGSSKPAAVFEWGCGRNNIASYKRTTDRSTQANIVYHNAAAGPDAPGFPTVVATDPTSIAMWGPMADVAQANIEDLTLRQALVNEHVAVRKDPRQLIEFQPHIDPSDGGRLPIFGVEYGVGDIVPARAKFNGTVLFDLQARVWGSSFAINAEGLEQQTLQLQP